MSQQKEKVALITGGSRGIGAAVAKRLAEDGARVALTYSSSVDKAAALVAATGGTAKAYQVDSADAEALRAAVEQVVSDFGRLDILINNAGVFSLNPIDEVTQADIDRSLNVNVRAVYVGSQQAVKHLPRGGRIINIGSVNGTRMPFPGGALYAMSKSALIGFTKGLSRDLAARGITVNTVDPGPTDTDMNPANGPFADAMHQLMALDRHGTPEEIASMVSYLASDEAAFITGANIAVDGGFLA